jgi:toxin YoeB
LPNARNLQAGRYLRCLMKITLEVPDHKAPFILEVLQAFSYVKTMVVQPREEPGMEETAYLLSTEANRHQLQEAIEQFQENGYQQHDVLEERIKWSSSAWDQYGHWQDTDRSVMRAINRLIDVCSLPRQSGTDDSIALSGPLVNFRSCRIADEHRMVYRLEGHTLCIASCMFLD